MATGGAAQPFFGTNGMGQNAMPQAAAAGQYGVQQAGANPLAVPQNGTFAGAPADMQATGSTLLPWNFQTTTPAPEDPYSAFLRALQQIQAANPITSIGSTLGQVPPGGMAHKPTGNINSPGYIPRKL